MVFCVTPFKIDQNKNQNRSVDKVQNLGNERRYIIKTLAKIQIRGIFRILILILTCRYLYGKTLLVLLDELQHGGRKQIETSVTEFCYKSVNSFFEKLINIKVILFLIHELFR